MYYLIALFNVIALYLAIKGNRNTWWFAIAGTTLASIMFYDDMMLSSFLFNVYSTICSIIALIKWKKTKNEMIFEMSNTVGIIGCILPCLLVLLNTFVFDSSNVLYDSLGPGLAIIATYLLVKRSSVAYVYWIACDINYLICGIVTNTTHYIVIYTVMLLLSIYGLYKNLNYGTIKLQPYLEQENMEMYNGLVCEENQVMFANVDEVELLLEDSYEIQVRDGKTFAVKKQPKYPKTIEDCADILNYNLWESNLTGYNWKLLVAFRKLLICRDAYWKIAGDWKPDWSDAKTPKYTIHVAKNKVVKDTNWAYNCILTFPTFEMRTAFHENFKDLIEECKELL